MVVAYCTFSTPLWTTKPVIQKEDKCKCETMSLYGISSTSVHILWRWVHCMFHADGAQSIPECHGSQNLELSCHICTAHALKKNSGNQRAATCLSNANGAIVDFWGPRRTFSAHSARTSAAEMSSGHAARVRSYAGALFVTVFGLVLASVSILVCFLSFDIRGRFRSNDYCIRLRRSKYYCMLDRKLSGQTNWKSSRVFLSFFSIKRERERERKRGVKEIKNEMWTGRNLARIVNNSL